MWTPPGRRKRIAYGSSRSVNQPPRQRTCLPSADRLSAYTSDTSALSAVMPQAHVRLRPDTIEGRPGTVAPATSSTPGTRRCTRWSGDGTPSERCGSFASIGFPLALRLGPTAKTLLA